MSELVEKEAVINMLHIAYMGGNEFYDDLFELTEKLPTVERKKGKWEFVGLQMFVCSECKHVFRQDWLMDWRTHNSEPIFPNFCPNCGAEMAEK